MHRLRAVLAALLVALLALAPAASGADAQSKRTKSSDKSVLDRLGSATTGFFKGVKNTLTPKSSSAKKTTTSTKKSSKSTGLSSSWFAKNQSKSTTR